MRRGRRLAVVVALLLVVLFVAAAQGANRPGVQISVLTKFAPGNGPAAVAATNQGDVAALAGSNVVSVGPNGQQKVLATISGGAFGIPIGIAYDAHHQLYVALPESFGPPAQ